MHLHESVRAARWQLAETRSEVKVGPKLCAQDMLTSWDVIRGMDQEPEPGSSAGLSIS